MIAQNAGCFGKDKKIMKHLPQSPTISLTENNSSDFHMVNDAIRTVNSIPFQLKIIRILPSHT